MKKLFGVLVFLMLAACGQDTSQNTGAGAASGDNRQSSGSATSAAATPGPWQTLFNGTDLALFSQNGDANWAIDEDWVGADSGNGMLVTRQVFADFELEVEFWTDMPANSGVFIRCPDPAEITDTTCYEVNIYDTRPDQTYRTGGIVNLAAPAQQMNAAGRWNRYQITARGDQLIVVLNGEQLVDVRDNKFTRGHIGLQYGQGVVRFRNVRIRVL